MKLITQFVAYTHESRRSEPVFLKLMRRLELEVALTGGEERVFLGIGQSQTSSRMLVTVRRGDRTPCSTVWTYAHEPDGVNVGGEYVYRWGFRANEKDPEAVIEVVRDLLLGLDAPSPLDVLIHRVAFSKARIAGWQVCVGAAEMITETTECSLAVRRGLEVGADRGVRCASLIQTTAFAW